MRLSLLVPFLAGIAAACATSTPAPSSGEPITDPALLVSDAHDIVLRTTANPAIRQGYVNTPEGQIHYWEAGTGPALLLIHQAASSAEEYAGLASDLADDFRLIAFDWPGHGMSDDPARELLVDDYTDSGVAVLDHLSITRAHVLGNHGGALVAMNLAWKHPARVDRLILSGTSGVKDMDAVQEFSDDLDLGNLNQTDRAGDSLASAWDRYTRYMPNSTPGEILRPFLNAVTVRVRPYDSHYGVLRFDRRPALKSIKDRRILLMQAENDPFVSDQETLLDILPNAERVVIEDTGVFQFFENPSAAADDIRCFLSAE